MVLNNQQVYHTSKTTIDLDVNTYLTIDPKVRAPMLTGQLTANTLCAYAKKVSCVVHPVYTG